MTLPGCERMLLSRCMAITSRICLHGMLATSQLMDPDPSTQPTFHTHRGLLIHLHNSMSQCMSGDLAYLPLQVSQSTTRSMATETQAKGHLVRCLTSSQQHSALRQLREATRALSGSCCSTAILKRANGPAAKVIAFGQAMRWLASQQKQQKEGWKECKRASMDRAQHACCCLAKRLQVSVVIWGLCKKASRAMPELA